VDDDDDDEMIMLQAVVKAARKFCLHMISKSINKDYFCLQMISVYFVLHTSTTILKPPVLACHIEPGSPPV